MCTNMVICVPNTNIHLHPECQVKLGRFERTIWVVRFGWFAWGGNRPMCGWYLQNSQDASIVKPLYQTDLEDIYLVNYV